MSEPENPRDPPHPEPPSDSQGGGGPFGRIRPLEIALAVALACGAGLALYYSQHRARISLPASALDRVEEIAPQPLDENLATFNALAYHLYALKSDVGQYERVRANLARLATGKGLEPGIEEADQALLDLCRETERFFVERRDLDEARRAGLNANLAHTAKAEGALAAGTAAKFAVIDVGPMGLALAGAVALGRLAGHVEGNRKVEKAYQDAVDKARLGLNDQLARTEHRVVNVGADLGAKYGWKPAATLSEAAFGVYADGLARFASADWEGALRAFDRVSAIPGMAEADFFAGLAWLAKGDRAKAAQRLTDAIERQPANFVYAREAVGAAHFHLARIAVDEKRWNDAIGHINAALQFSPDEADLHCLRGEILLDTGHSPEAVEAFQAALRIDERSPRAAYGLAQALADRGQTNEAMEWLRQAARDGGINRGPFSDAAVLTNKNVFPLTHLEATVRRKNSGENKEFVESAKKEALAPGEEWAIQGAIRAGPKSRTEYFDYQLRCDQGEWKAHDKVAAERR
ncbi:MAG: tetratricopeptide repeat protein [Candidatus Sumerlaeota bacterium]|nr:tetratricopeptide repeat protein [Candidatus Sumerlaeota bacterium]